MVILHKNILTKLEHTPDGKLYDEDLCEIYALLLINLNLKDVDAKTGNGFSLGVILSYVAIKSHIPYAFLEQAAYTAMKSLKLEVSSSKTLTATSYSIGEKLGRELLQDFFAAKLLHTPVDRTRSEPKKDVLLQPTPKGVAVLQDYVERIGMKWAKYPPILNSRFNSMYLIKLDRDLNTDKILYSKYLINLIFIAMMGERPNVWTAEDKPDKLPLLSEKLKILGNSRAPSAQQKPPVAAEQSYSEMLRQQYQMGSLNDELGLTFTKFLPPSSPCRPQSGNGTVVAPETPISPFYHRYFTNPESDAHVQYYTSSTGLRVFGTRAFYPHEELVKCCFSGKAVLQWLCDCTYVMTRSQGMALGSLFLKLRLIEPIMQPPSVATFECFSVDRNAFYRLSKLGSSVCHWTADEHDTSSFSDDNSLGFGVDVSTLVPSRHNTRTSTVTLAMVLKDPGLRYLFKIHLAMEFCLENIELYLAIRQFQGKVKTLDRIMAENSERAVQTAHKYTAKLVSRSYSIYLQYITTDAPRVLNLDSGLRDKIVSHMGQAATGGSLLLVSDEYAYVCQTNKLLNEVKNSVYRLMEMDSLPKFLNSKVYRESMMTIEVMAVSSE